MSERIIVNGVPIVAVPTSEPEPSAPTTKLRGLGELGYTLLTRLVLFVVVMAGVGFLLLALRANI